MALALAGCAARDTLVEADSSALRITPYPYNADIHGEDLPVEIARFDAPADYDDEHDDRQIELGFLRYPAADGAEGPPIVFLLDEPASGAVPQALILELRQLGDVVLFNRRGYGFSSPPPPCPERLSYPFDQPLTRSELTERTCAHAARCLDALARDGIVPSEFAAPAVSRDLLLLAQVLETGTIRLVAAGEMVRPAMRAIRETPELVTKAVLTGMAGPEAADRQVGASAAVPDKLAERLRGMPAEVDYLTNSGRSIPVRIGELDLAFLRAEMGNAHADDRAALLAAIESAMQGELAALTAQVVDMRRRIGDPDSILLLTASDSAPCAAGKASEALSPQAYAAGWPGSALRAPTTPPYATAAEAASEMLRDPDRVLLLPGVTRDGTSGDEAAAEAAMLEFLAGPATPDD